MYMFIFFTFATMEKVYAFYKDNIAAQRSLSDNYQRKMHLLGSVRLALVVGAGVFIWLLRNEDWRLIVGVILLFIIAFAVLMVFHNKLSHLKDYADALRRLNEDELKGLDYDFSAFDGAADKISGDHSFSLDLDLFGDRSLFQSINRTATPLGRELLAGWFISPLKNKQAILKRQEAVKQIAAYTDLRQDLFVYSSKQLMGKNDPKILQSLVSRPDKYMKSTFWKIMIWLVPAIWIVLIGAYAMELINGSIVGLYLAISFLIAYLPGKGINDLYITVDKMQKIFSIYSKMMLRIENVEKFESDELNEIHSKLLREGGRTASYAIRQLSGCIGGLDQRFSAAGIILNLFYLRDMRHAMDLERWKQTYKDEVEIWLSALAHFDALSSLGGFAFNHPEYIYPEIADTYFRMKGKGLGHPLLNRKVCVKNDIDIEKSPWFLIITGANMAGKSTYLRTVGVNYLLGCVGAPVCAQSLRIYPANLVTSLRTSDSLASNESYFFAELKRLKMIIDRLKDGEELFIILDEILKGTNSVDKQKGSLALMRQLINYKTCGIIATHDLVLGTLEKEFPNQIKNYRFEADITNDKLTFTYLLREGIAQNMNAYYLMKKMGITLE